MAGSVNRAILLGNIGRDAELRFTKSGVAVAGFSLATTEKFTGKSGEKRENTQWHKVNVWGTTAEAIHTYLTKGKQVYVEGRIETTEWTNKDGQKQKSTEIRADKVVLLGGGKRDDSRGGHVSDEEMAASPEDDDIGF